MNCHGTNYRRVAFAATAFAAFTFPLIGIAQESGAADSTRLASTPSRSPMTDSLLRRAVRDSNPQLAASRIALRAAEARARASGHRPAAAINGEAEEIPGGVDLTHAGSVRIDVEQELLSGSLTSAQRAVATSEIEIARSAIQVTERRLFAALDRDLTRLAGWSAIARRLAAEDDLFSSAEASLRGRFAVGDAKYVDVLRLRTERLRVQSERAAALTEASAARTAIVALIRDDGTGGDAAPKLDAVTRIEPTFTLGPIPGVDSLLSASGALQLSRSRLARADALRRLVLAEQGRRMTASLGAQRFQTESGRYSLGPAVAFSTTLPFTARKANQAREHAAALDLRVEEAEQRAYLAVLRGAISIAHDRYEAARRRLNVYETALLRGAREERESALASFRAGELSLTELLDFERALARAEVDRMRARIEAAEALGAIYATLDEADRMRARSDQ